MEGRRRGGGGVRSLAFGIEQEQESPVTRAGSLMLSG